MLGLPQRDLAAALAREARDVIERTEGSGFPWEGHSEDLERFDAFAEVIAALAFTGQPEAAQALKEELVDEQGGPPVPYDVHLASILALSGRVSEAKKLIAGVSDENKDDALVEIARWLALDGMAGQAVKLSRALLSGRNLDRALVAIVLVLSEKGQIADARRLAATVARAGLKAIALAALTSGAARLGKKSDAEAFLSEALILARRSADPAAHAALVSALGSLRTAREVINHAGLIPDIEERNTALFEAYKKLVQRGERADADMIERYARETVPKPAQASKQNGCASEADPVSFKHTRSGRAADALRAAAAIAELGKRITTFSCLSVMFADAGKARESRLALSQARAAASAVQRAEADAISDAAVLLARAGLIGGARELIERIRDDSGERRRYVLERAVASLAETGRVEESLRLIEGDDFNLSWIAYLLAGNGFYAEATRLAEAVKRPSSTVEAFTRLAELALRKGRRAEGLAMARKASDYLERVSRVGDRDFMLAEVVRVHVALKDIGAAQRAIESSIVWAQGLSNPDERAKALTQVATLRAEDWEHVWRDSSLPVQVLRSAEHAATLLDRPDDRARVYSLLASRYHAAGQPDDALRTADVARDAASSAVDPAARAYALSSAAVVFARANRVKDAGDMAGKALVAARAIPAARRERVRVFRAVVTALALAGNLDSALAASTSIEDTASRFWTLARAAEGLAAVGDAERALTLAFRIPSPRSSDIGLGMVADMLSQKGMLGEAQQAAQAIRSPKQRAEALWHVASWLADAGKLTDARAVCSGSSNPKCLTTALDAAAQRAAVAGDGPRSVAFAESISGPQERVETLTTVVTLLAKAGATSDAALPARAARDVAATIGSAEQRNSGLQKAVTALVAAGLLDEALAAANLLTSAALHDQALSIVVSAMIRAGALDRAVSVSRTITAPAIRGETLASASLALAKARRKTEARSAALEAVGNLGTAAGSSGIALVAQALVRSDAARESLPSAERIADVRVRTEFLLKLSAALVESGQPALARQALQRARKAAVPGWNSEEVAGLLARLGEVQNATAMARNLPSADGRLTALASVALGLAQTGRVEEATAVGQEVVELAGRQAEAEGEGDPLSYLVDALLRARDIAAAKEVAVKLRYGSDRGGALAQVAVVLWQEGRKEEATAMADAAWQAYIDGPTWAATRSQMRVYGSQAESSIIGTLAFGGMARKVAEMIRGTWPGADELAACFVKGLRNQGRFREAHDLDHFANLETEHENPDVRNVHTLITTGKVDQAVQAATAMSNPRAKDEALELVIEALVDAGRLDQAEVLTPEVQDEYQKDYVKGAVAAALLRTGNLARAVSHARQLNDSPMKAKILARATIRYMRGIPVHRSE